MNTSIFDKKEWAKMLPKQLTIITLNGRFILKLTDDPSSFISIIGPDQVQITYRHNTMEENNGDACHDGEPDYLEFDLSLSKINDGTEANAKNLKIDVDITYGDAMVSEFSISQPNNVNVTYYTGPGATNVKSSMFGFSHESLSELIKFFNRFGFNLDVKSFKFIDEHLDEYIPESKRKIFSYDNFLLEGVYEDGEKHLSRHIKQFLEYEDNLKKEFNKANNNIILAAEECLVDIEEYLINSVKYDTGLYNHKRNCLAYYEYRINENVLGLFENLTQKLNDVIGEKAYKTDINNDMPLLDTYVDMPNHNTLFDFLKKEKMNLKFLTITFYINPILIKKNQE